MSKGNNYPYNIDWFKKQEFCLDLTDPNYKQPSTADLVFLIQHMGWNQKDISLIVGAKYTKKSGSSAIRSWTTTKKHHVQIPYSSWRLLLVTAGIVSQDNVNNSLNNLKS